MRLLLVLCLVVCICMWSIEAAPAKGKGKSRSSGNAAAAAEEPAAGESEPEGEGGTAAGKGKGKEKKKPKKAKHGGAQKFPDHGRKSKQQRDAERLERVAKSVATKGKPGKSKKKQPKTKEQRDKMKGACAKKEGGCKGQTAKTRDRKSKAEDLWLAAKRAQYKFVNRTPTTEEEAELRTELAQVMAKTLEAKRALLKAQGFEEGEVDPEDDGLWGGDVFLTVAQAQKIIDFQNKNDTEDDEGPPPLPTPAEAAEARRFFRKKRYAVYMEDNVAAKFDEMPIKYVFGPLWDDTQKETIRNGIKDIETKSCVRFVEVDEVPATPHIYFQKMDYAPFCELSPTGRTGNQNVNQINAADCGYILQGMAAHSVLHSLGIEHEHIRYDRTTYISVNYDNMDPTVMDHFEPGDNEATTGYGTKYDYYSIMHDNAWAGAIDDTIAVMTPTKEPMPFFKEVIGQREGLSEKDGELVRKLYCSPDCSDLEVWCGWWATDNLCVTNTEVMIDYCPKSCQFCPMAASQIARDNLLLYGASKK